MAERAKLAAPKSTPEKEQSWHQVKWGAVSLRLVLGGDRRIDAENYLSSGYGIRVNLEDRAYGWQRLRDLAQIWTPPRLKGILVSSEFGTPYLNTSQVFDIRPTPRKWLSLEKTPKAESRFAKSGTILVMASASVGRSTLTTIAHEGALLSHHFMRVEPTDATLRGWVYAFLRSPQGYAMMTSSQYASVIRHIEPSHLGALPIPIVNDECARQFNTQITTILDLRNRAYRLTVEAEEYYSKAIGIISPAGESGFPVNASALFSGRRRLEANYHAPLPTAIWGRFREMKARVDLLAHVTNRVWWMPRFKRFYGDDGIPYLSADELFTINPLESKRILVAPDDNHPDYFVRTGWIVMACSGQVYGLNGAAMLMTKHHENTFFSHDLIRIVPNAHKIRSGYLLVTLTHPELGRPLLIRAAYGTSIPHLDPNDVAAFPVVRLEEREEERIADLAEESAMLRAEADEKERALSAAAGVLIDRFIAGDLRDFVTFIRPVS